MAGTTTGSRTKKHSRSRTGCFTCRKRRVKCDEQKPVCGRCKKGTRECVYPDPPSTKSKPPPSKTETSGKPPPSPASSPSIDFDLSDDEAEDLAPKVLVRFSSSSSQGSGSPETDVSQDQFALEFDQQMLIDSLAAPPDSIDPLFNPNPLMTFSVAGTSPNSFCQELLYPSPKAVEPGLIRLARPPKDTRTHPVQFFLNYHHENVTHSHYFVDYDRNNFYSSILPGMAADSPALKHALVAFSALIYSLKIDRGAREQAFLYYALALQQLRELLNTIPTDTEECQVAIATALQLSTFDRFFGDAAKCFRHLQGAAYIMQKFSDPVTHCSTVTGRCLLQLYCNVEDYCCSLSTYHALLPTEWRYQNVRIHQQLAHEEYPHIPIIDRKPRLLNDLWPQLEALRPDLNDILVSIPHLKTMEGQDRIDFALLLEAQLQQFDRELTGFINSNQVSEVLQIAPLSSPITPSHSGCCPPFPYSPLLFVFPPAAFLNISLQAMRTHMRAFMYPAISTELDPEQAPGLPGEDATYYSIEICRTFAGIEESYKHSPDSTFPCFSPLVLAALTCPPSLRMWMRGKLSHFERLSQLCFEPVKQNLAKVWDMPQILEGFSPSTSPPLDTARVSWSVITEEVGEVDLLSEEINWGDDSMESFKPCELFGVTYEEGDLLGGL